MSEIVVNDQQRRATVERIASYTVGIAVENNTGIGSGILVTTGADRYILTAAHVIDGSDINKARFWLRPPSGMIEKAAIDTNNQEVGRMTMGSHIPMSIEAFDKNLDFAVLKIDPTFEMPKGPECYPIIKSREFSAWPNEALDGVTLTLYGFPTANARLLHTVGSNTTLFLGTAYVQAEYSAELNNSGFKGLPYTVSSEKDFLFEYKAEGDNMHPRGFSGCGIWVAPADNNPAVWKADPLLIGMAHKYFDKRGLIAGTKLPAMITMTPE